MMNFSIWKKKVRRRRVRSSWFLVGGAGGAMWNVELGKRKLEVESSLLVEVEGAVRSLKLAVFSSQFARLPS
jgi:hypothetical protein